MWFESPPRSSLPKEVYADADVIEKARAMIRAGGSDPFVSDYLGMAAAQVAAIREGLRAPARGRPPGPGLPADDGREDRAEAAARRRDAERGSAALLAAIRLYFARHPHA